MRQETALPGYNVRDQRGELFAELRPRGLRRKRSQQDTDQDDDHAAQRHEGE